MDYHYYHHHYSSYHYHHGSDAGFWFIGCMALFLVTVVAVAVLAAAPGSGRNEAARRIRTATEIGEAGADLSLIVAMLSFTVLVFQIGFRETLGPILGPWAFVTFLCSLGLAFGVNRAFHSGIAFAACVRNIPLPKKKRCRC